MEVRQLEAFVAVATELHFGRAAERLYMGQPALSGLVRRLERELGTRLFFRTTRRVELTNAGLELLAHAKIILDDFATAAAAVRAIALTEAGAVRVGITPPVGPVLAPHLCQAFAAKDPDAKVVLEPMWLPALPEALATGEIDVIITCGIIPAPNGVVNAVFCAEPLLVGIPPGHPLSGRDSIRLADLAEEVLGRTHKHIFPAWAMSQRQALEAAAVDPPSIPLEDADLCAARWLDQRGVGWIMLIGSLARRHTSTVIKPVDPPYLVPFTLQWNPRRAQTTAVSRFVRTVLTVEPPPGFLTQPATCTTGPARPGPPRAPRRHSRSVDTAAVRALTGRATVTAAPPAPTGAWPRSRVPPADRGRSRHPGRLVNAGQLPLISLRDECFRKSHLFPAAGTCELRNGAAVDICADSVARLRGDLARGAQMKRDVITAAAPASMAGGTPDAAS